MLKFTVHTGNLNESLSSQINNAANKAELAVAQQVLKDTSPYVPALTGSLDQRAYVDGDKIIYPGPYARFLYFGKVMVDPNTGSTYAPKGGSKVVTDRNLIFNKTMHGQAQSHWFEASKAQNLDKWIGVADKAVKKDLGKQ